MRLATDRTPHSAARLNDELYKEEGATTQNRNDFYWQIAGLNQLVEGQKGELDVTITREEIEMAIVQLASGKEGGLDSNLTEV
ncbi:hypothetical protein NDU88_005873 [Pleurodeles waltl]|uniref:Uncharacterized protein n=1 Tax=Pleurodeles waltl TaxID=8319 RepID=A0AAV7SMW4_PLEWA|nr:hypothetical protein NDU88_005873 [Pleurodeles waltl]